MRNAWRTAWGRQLERLPLTPLQAQMAEVIALHPEYQAQLTARSGPTAQPESSDAATQAFLHLALHLALREQLSTNRPEGIVQIHRRLSAHQADNHEAEHRMIGVLEQTLWEAQRAGRPPDEALYLEALRRL